MGAGNRVLLLKEWALFFILKCMGTLYQCVRALCPLGHGSENISGPFLLTSVFDSSSHPETPVILHDSVNWIVPRILNSQKFYYEKVRWVKSQMQELALVVLSSIVCVKNLDKECCGPILPHGNEGGLSRVVPVHNLAWGRTGI